MNRIFRPFRSATIAAGVMVSATFVLAGPASAQNLLTNGGLEAGNFTGANPGGATGSTQLFVGDTNITGWTVVNAEIAWLQNGNPYSVVASDGVRTLDLTGYHDASPYGGITQTLATTVGTAYTLTFNIGAGAGSTSGVTASAGSTSQNFVFAASGTGATYQYGTQTLNFTATGATTAITLIGSSTSNGNNLGLDNISVTRVGGAAAPEPGSLALLGLGIVPLAGLVARRRR